MTQPFADALSWVPKSRALGASLTRAHDMARAQGHGAVRLEHLLLALIEDPDAAAVMLACNVDLLQLNGTVTAHLQTFPAGEPLMPVADGALVRILEYAVAAARQSRRGEVNGAIVLAAVVGEGNSEAAQILRHHGLTFQDTVKALQRTNAPRTAPATGSASAPPDAPPQQPPARQAGQADLGSTAAGSVRQSHIQPGSQPMPRAAAPQGAGPATSGPVGSDSGTVALAEARRRIEAMRGGPLAGASAGAAQSRAPVGQPVTDGQRSAAAEAAGQAQNAAGAVDASPPAELRRAGVGASPELPAREAFSEEPVGGRLPIDGQVTVATSGQAVSPPATHSPHLNIPTQPPNRAEAVLSAGPNAGTWAPPARPAEPESGAGASRRMPPPVPPMTAPQNAGPPTLPPPLPSQNLQPAASDVMRGRIEPPWAGKAPPIEPLEKGADAGLGAMPAPEPFEAGRLLGCLPTHLRSLASTVVEVKLPRSAVFSIEATGQLPGRPHPQSLAMPRALTMRLRSQTGNCYVETAAPETQFFNARTSYNDDDIVRWRWVVTAKRRGVETLALAVSMRSIGPDGVAIETRLPDQAMAVPIVANLQRMSRTAAMWGAAVLLGGLVVLLVSGAWPLLAAAAGRLLG